MVIILNIYLDNSATTMVCEEAAEKALYMMTQCYGNPSSLHSMGFKAEKEVEAAREAIAEKLFCKTSEVFFTSGGTESNNLAVLSGANSRKRFGKKIVTTALEHPSVLEAMRELENQGFHVVYLMPDKNGIITSEMAAEAVDTDTVLVSMMSVNNETGLIMPLEAVRDAIKQTGSRALFHVDNVQGFCKIPLHTARLGIDLMSVSGHKIHGPKGVGALYIKEKTRLAPRILGGGQEKGMRSGTENVPAICAMGAAVQSSGDQNENYRHVLELNRLLAGKLSEINGVGINSPEGSLPYILNFSCGEIRGETMLHFLESRGIYVSTGSACSKAKPSHVLTAMGLPKNRISSSIRVSFSRYSREEDIAALAEAITEGMAVLAH